MEVTLGGHIPPLHILLRIVPRDTQRADTVIDGENSNGSSAARIIEDTGIEDSGKVQLRIGWRQIYESFGLLPRAHPQFVSRNAHNVDEVHWCFQPSRQK